MAKDFEVSFNSPQCGWMSIGFEHADSEFHTTTAYAPHRTALSDLLSSVGELVTADIGFSRCLKWNRDPEEYDFVFTKDSKSDASIEIIEYPTAKREAGERVYEFTGDAAAIGRAFVTTFQQLYDEKDIDEFEENWHQVFPVREFENLKAVIESR